MKNTSKFYASLCEAVKGVKIDGCSRVCYAPDCKSVVKRGEKSRVIESGYLILATMPKGKTLLADAAKEYSDISALKPFFKPKNKNRAIVATYVLQMAWGLPEVIATEKFKEADAAIALWEKGMEEYDDKMKNDPEFHASEIAKKIESENNRHDKRLAKLATM